MKKTEIIKIHAKANNQFFAKWSKYYNWFECILFPIRKKTVQFLDSRSTHTVLDIATGNGGLAVELAKSGYDVTGVDLSPDMLNLAKKKLHPKLKILFIQADAAKLPFKENTFDAATISFALHDMPDAIELMVLQEMKRVTKKSGQIIIADYMEPRKHWAAKLSHPLISRYESQNYVPFIERGLDAILADVNLKPEKRDYSLGFGQIVTMKNKKNST